MKKLFILFLPIFLFASMQKVSVELSKQEKEFLNKHKNIKVHMENSYMPFSNIVNSKFIGYSIDYANIISNRLGVNFSYNQNENWSQAIDNLKSKKIDIVAQMVNTKKRQEFTLFSDSYMKFYQSIVTKKENNHLDSMKKLKSKKVGAIRGYNSINVILSNYPSIKIVPYSDMHELLKNVYLGNIDAAVTTHKVAQYNINKLFLNELISIPVIHNSHMPRSYESFGIRKDWPLLHSSLQKAIKSITAQEISALEVKWFSKKIQKKIELTEKEKEFINTHPIIKVGNDRLWPPFDFYEHNKAQGFNVDFLNEISKLSGLKFEFVQDKSWEALIDRFKHRDIDILTALEPTPKRREFALFSDDILVTFESMVIRDNYPAPNSYKDLYGKKVGVIKGYDFENEIRDNHKEIEMILFDNSLAALQALSDSKINVFIENSSVSKYLISKHFLSNLKVGASPKFPNIEDGDKIKIASRSDYPELNSIIQKAIKNMSEEIKKDLRTKWLSQIDPNKITIDFTKEELSFLDTNKITMCIDPNWMPFEKFENSQHIGMSADYFKLIEKNLNKKIDLVKTSSWTESIEFAKNRKCDILSLAMSTPDREEYMNFTSPYLSVPIVLAAGLDTPFITDFDSITDKKIGITEDYAFIDILQQKYPNLNIVKVKNITDGLNRVRSGELFAYAGALASVAYIIQNEFTNEFKIVGKFDDRWNLGIAVRDDNKLLLNIFQKSLDAISEEQSRKITNKWISVRYEKGTDYTLMWQIIFVAIVIILGVLFWIRKLSLLNNELKLARKKADEATQVKANFLANMSHEIRTPMNSILGMSYLMKETSLNEIQSDYIQKIERSSNNLLHLLNEILDFSKLEAKKLEIQKINFNLLETINNVESLIKIDIFEKALEFDVVYDKNSSMHFFGDELRLSQILINLLSNAVKFTHDGKIELLIQKVDDARVYFCISDTGIGLTPEQMENIFSSFTQADSSTTREYGGTGLGLAISKELVELMRGELKVESIFGDGSKFSFEIDLEFSDKKSDTPTKKQEETVLQNRDDKTILNKNEVKKLFNKLKEAAQKRRPQLCEPILQEFETYSLEKDDEILFQSVKNLIKKYKFDEARNLL
ncbi:MAG: transporter substrate-binding domain-containing protein [Campylobacterota bacterium]|nr:transporter substrate-binding domain-containing protein [Campylobacterota bacterium]